MGEGTDEMVKIVIIKNSVVWRYARTTNHSLKINTLKECLKTEGQKKPCSLPKGDCNPD